MLVQFGNNWIQNIPRSAKLDEALGRPSPIWQSSFGSLEFGIFRIQLFPNWTACSPITYTEQNKIILGRARTWPRPLYRVAVEYRFLLSCIADNFSGTLAAGCQIKAGLFFGGRLIEVVL